MDKKNNSIAPENLKTMSDAKLIEFWRKICGVHKHNVVIVGGVKITDCDGNNYGPSGMQTTYKHEVMEMLRTEFESRGGMENIRASLNQVKEDK